MYFPMTVSKCTAPSPAWWPPYISWQKDAENSESHVAAATWVLSPLTILQAVWKFTFALCRLRPVARFTFSTPLPSLEVSSVCNGWTLRLYGFCSGKQTADEQDHLTTRNRTRCRCSSQLDLAQYRLFNSAHKQLLNSGGRSWMHDCRALNCLE
jgi:hypothetical protein